MKPIYEDADIKIYSEYPFTYEEADELTAQGYDVRYLTKPHLWKTKDTVRSVFNYTMVSKGLTNKEIDNRTKVNTL